MNTTILDKLMRSTALLAMIAIASPAYAQDEGSTESGPVDFLELDEEAEEDEIVITGSRIRRNEFTAPVPVQVISTERTKLSGLLSASEILQGSSVAAGSGQINDTFTGFVVNGGAGVNTLSLRGLGAQRTLVLLNGRRVGPSGVSGTVSAVDLNIIPNSVVNRFEILKDGASSIYGSDKNTEAWLRSYEEGKLKVSVGNMLPWNTVDGDFPIHQGRLYS